VGTYPLTITGAVTNLNHSTPVTLIVNPAATTTGISSSANPSSFGDAVTFTATVSSPLATGTVQFKDGANPLGSAVNVTSGVATRTVSSLVPGTHSITAIYNGDANFLASTSSALQQTVSRTAAVVAVSSNLDPASAGQTVTFTATLTPPTATGMVQFQDGNTNLGSAVALSSGVATFPTSALVAGTHSITASYQGDSNFLSSTSPALTEVIMTTGAAATTTQLSGAPATTIYFHQRTPISFSVAVATNPPSGSTPQGKVSFLDGSTELGEATLDAGGSATYTPPPNSTLLRRGPHNLQAVYIGTSGSFNGSSDAKTVNSSPRPRPR
jgi:hypothetical protein